MLFQKVSLLGGGGGGSPGVAQAEQKSERYPTEPHAKYVYDKFSIHTRLIIIVTIDVIIEYTRTYIYVCMASIWWSPCVRGCPDAGWPGPGRSEGLHRASPTTSVPRGSRTPITRARAGPNCCPRRKCTNSSLGAPPPFAPLFSNSPPRGGQRSSPCRRGSKKAQGR